MFILSMGLAITGVKVHRLYSEQRFFSESQQILSQLTLAQDLMLILDADVEVKIGLDEKTKKVFISLEVEKALPERWARLIERRLVLPSIQSFDFMRVDNLSSDQDPLILEFSFGRMPRGTLVLSAEKNLNLDQLSENDYKIELPGYPAALGKSSSDMKDEQNKEDSPQLYPIEVYEKISKKKKSDN